MDMKESDLRIGNYLMYFDDIVKVDSIRKDNTYYLGARKGSTVYYNTIDAYEAIPLTEEWLEKFGYNKSDQSIQLPSIDADVWIKFYEQHKELGELDYNYGILLVNDYVIKDDIKYVHQLQNLFFSLTEKELTIKPIT